MQGDQPQAQIAVDPNLATEQAQAQATLISGLQTQAQGDTAALMSRYGTRLALGGTASPAAAAPAPAAATAAPSDPFAGTMFAGKFGAVLASTVAR